MVALTSPDQEYEMNTNHFINLSSASQAILKAAQSVDATVLITGSTGTGKSFLAEKIHALDPKRGMRRLVKVNLATLSENLIESELFGHERGAFTGADARRPGKLESADGGTVFLDEIGELPLRLQSKLLDFIQYKKITPVGSNRELKIDVRIVVATNKNLEASVRAGQFREDLFHRLNVFRVHIADLATMPQTALDFAQEMLRAKAEGASKSISHLSRELQSAIRHYPWPGNIRELENAIEFAVAMEKSNELTIDSMPVSFRGGHSGVVAQTNAEPVALNAAESGGISNPACVLELPVSLNYHESKELFEKRYIEFILKSCNGHINLTSRRTGLNKVSLTDKIKRYGIDWRKIRFESIRPH